MTDRVDEIRMTAGELVAGRYRLTTRASSEAGHDLWHADDDILGRAVAVRLVCGPESRLSALHAAATRAGGLVHDGVAAIYDTGTIANCVYIVREWVPGESLQDLLAAGPLDNQMVSDLGVQLSDILTAVKGAGLHHRRLHARNVIVTPNGGVKVTDLETADALDNRHAPETQWFGGVLYAALTARWPYLQLPAPKGLQQAAMGDDDTLCRPAQMRAGVPGALDAVTMRTLTDDGAGDLQRLAEPLRQLPRRPPGAEFDEPPQPEVHVPLPAAKRRAWIGLTLGLLTAVVLLLWVAAQIKGPVGNIPFFQKPTAAAAAGASQGASREPSASAGAAARPLAVTAVRDYDPFGDDGSEDPARVGLTINGNPADGWHTDGYFDPLALIGKKGVGVVLDLGKPVTPHEFAVTFAAPGTTWELRAADSAGPAFASTRAVATASTAGATTTAVVPDGTASRYWVVWLTELPRTADGKYRSEIREIVVS